MDRLVECVPNFSEGRNADTLRSLVAAVRSVRGVFLLDQEMDQDHHRAVMTFVGAPEAVVEAAFQAARAATSLIDLRQHQGGHPRVGATDVVPFVPLQGVRMEDCVALARMLGERIGNELGIPVFLYERAASRPERAQLESIRRGGLDGLAARMKEPAWIPDFGPGRPHPTAGATVVGARPPLIAYNVNLQTEDLGVAKAIARAVRFSSGGLPFVKAIGVALPSRRLVQVSMNLTNFEETPIHVAFEAVGREAERLGVQVGGSEVIGLVPQRALIQASEFFLKLERFDPGQVLETRLRMVLARETQPERQAQSAPQLVDWASSVAGFLAAVATGTPTPGGGSVAALAGALAASLGVMACRIGPPATVSGGSVQTQSPEGKTDRPDHGADLQRAEWRLVELGARLQGLVQADAEAYQAVVQAYQLPKTDKHRPGAISASLAMATRVPLQTAELAYEAATLLRSLIPHTKPSVASDLKVGLLMAVAAMEGGLENIATNIKIQTNQEFVSEVLETTQVLKESLVELKRLC
jgi:glutamate formiminotransferase/glutamate formiminotransferase/formiminotetrahydrofolate cyclodeaminase